jgi:hypothetical protein
VTHPHFSSKTGRNIAQNDILFSDGRKKQFFFSFKTAWIKKLFVYLQRTSGYWVSLYKTALTGNARSDRVSL